MLGTVLDGEEEVVEVEAGGLVVGGVERGGLEEVEPRSNLGRT